MQHHPLICPEQMRHCGSGSKCSCSSCRVKDPVVGTAKKGPDAYTCLVTHNSSGQHILSRGSCLLRSGENSWKDDRCRVKYSSIMDIVLLNDMRGRSVYQSSEQRGGSPTRDQNLTWT